MTPVIAERLTMLGIDLVSDVLIDLAFRYQAGGIETITPDDLLKEAARLKALRKTEMEKVKARIADADKTESP